MKEQVLLSVYEFCIDIEPEETPEEAEKRMKSIIKDLGIKHKVINSRVENKRKDGNYEIF